jgi:uncharacterized protein
MKVASEVSLEDRLISLVAKSRTTMRALEAARDLRLSSWCIGAGVVRNLVWDHLHRFELETSPEDIDLVFYDASNLPQNLELHLEATLAKLEPTFAWEVVNQATVHHWLKSRFAKEVQPFQSLEQGVASWPEIATCVGITLAESGKIDVIAPHGLTDLFDMVVRWNPRRVSREVYMERMAQKRFAERWPMVKVLTC